ncbi:hypothetical protein BGZ94_000190 [Podila epigama]|nr:hypothetical protein BGZ94_000190 [Podila epigama]
MGGINNMELYRLPAGSKQLDLVGDIKAKLKKRTKTIGPPARRAPSPLPSAATTANTGPVVPLKTRVIQLLALQPLGLVELQSKVGAGDLHTIMPMVATLSGGKYILKAEAYREVKIYDWKNYSAKQREIVVKNASAAFDKLGLPADALERSKLLPERVRHSPPLVAEGYHVAGTMDNSSKWRSNGGGGGGGGGSESEGLENGKSGSLKPSSARKKTTTKKSTTTPLLNSKKKNTSSSKSSSKSSVRSLDIATILDQVPNHSAKAATGTNLKPPGSVHAARSPNVTGRRPSITATNGNGVTNVVPKKGPEARKVSGSNKDTGGVSSGYKIPKVGSGTSLPRKPPSPGFVIPTIRTQAEYEEFSRQFMEKYQELKKLRTVMDEKKTVLEDRRVLRLSGEPRFGVSVERAAAAKADQIGRMSIKTMAERYKVLHAEAEAMRNALFEAVTAAADRNGLSGAGGGGGGGG